MLKLQHIVSWNNKLLTVLMYCRLSGSICLHLKHNIITMLSALAICHHHPYSVAHMYMHLLMSSHVEHLNQASRQLLNLH